jgi:chromosome segregation and condensation protein ScpB
MMALAQHETAIILGGIGRIFERTGRRERGLEMTTASLEALACIAFKQPISQGEIDLLFDADKRGWWSNCGIRSLWSF